MCSPIKHWNSIYAREIPNDGLLVGAIRSDGVMFEQLIQFEEELIRDNISLVKEAIAALESYRNCLCTQTSFCENHLKDNK